MARLRLGKRTVDASLPGPRDTFVWDTELRGFGLKITPNGAKSYVVQYRMGGREAAVRRYTIGKHGSPWTPERARAEADRLLILVGRGIDPITEDRRRRSDAIDLAFESYADRFVENYLKVEWKRTWPEAKRILDRDLKPAFRRRALPEIGRREITALLDTMSGRPAMAQQAGTILRKLFRWAVSRGDIATSPMADMTLPGAVQARDRVLSDGELAQIWTAANELAYPFGPMVRLLIATGQRRDEVAAMAWSEVDLEIGTWLLPAARAKNGKVHIVPLNAPAIVELTDLARLGRKGLVFTTTGKTAVSGFSHAKRRLDGLLLSNLRRESTKPRPTPEDVSVEPWRFHDLRRSVATGMQRLGVRLEVTEAVLNHVSGSRAGVVGIYQRHDWAHEKRGALDEWGTHLARIVQAPRKTAHDHAAAHRLPSVA